MSKKNMVTDQIPPVNSRVCNEPGSDRPNAARKHSNQLTWILFYLILHPYQLIQSNSLLCDEIFIFQGCFLGLRTPCYLLLIICNGDVLQICSNIRFSEPGCIKKMHFHECLDCVQACASKTKWPWRVSLCVR